ncbi:MAG: IS66 family insertion sequence element accessory protein TnpB [Myxococcales bacterium]|nr:IS66 family insertion sequence element accessory protein TnpB [Myxococcales bacterium]
MFGSSSISRLATCDMRKQMDGLSTLVREEMKRDPQDGELYLFRNRTRGLIKILFCDHGGYCLLAKRLCKGRFRIKIEELEGKVQASLSKCDLAELLSDTNIQKKSDRRS